MQHIRHVQYRASLYILYTMDKVITNHFTMYTVSCATVSMAAVHTYSNCVTSQKVAVYMNTVHYLCYIIVALLASD